jgi:tetratricopeptide (TPR) repeat protein
MVTKRYEQAVKAYLDSREAFQKGVALQAMGDVASDRRVRDQIQMFKDVLANVERGGKSNPLTSKAKQIDQLQEQIRQLEGRVSRSRTEPTPPVPAGLSLALGSAYFRTNQLADAEREYKAAISVRPSFGEAHSNLAVIYMLTDRVAAAEEEVKLAERAGYRVNPKLKEDLKKRRD